MSEREPAPPISVTGGAGGHVALTEDLHHASWVLEGAAAEVDEAAFQLRMAAFWLEQARPDGVAGVGGIVSHTLDEVEDARHGVVGAGVVSADISDAAVRVAAVARAYEDAEAGAHRRIGSADWWREAGVGVLQVASIPSRLYAGTALKAGAFALRGVAWAADRQMSSAERPLVPMWATTEAGSQLWAEFADAAADAVLPDPRLPNLRMPDHDFSITRLLNGGTVGTVLGWLDHPSGPLPSRYETTAAQLAVAVSLLERIAKEPLYTGVVYRAGSSRQVDPSAGVADLMTRIEEIRGPHGAIAVETITDADGSRRHVVFIPGTNDNGVAGASTFDYGSNLPAVQSRHSDSEQLVLDALEAAGIRRGEGVMLVGHSQGGIMAARVAATARDQYDISHVVTAGSPTDRIEYQDEVQYLNLLNDPDLVPGTDGKAPVDRPHVTTVAGHLWDAEAPELAAAAGGIASSHAIKTYAATGRAADASMHHSMKTWRAGASDFLGRGEVTRREFEPTFTDPEPPAEPAPARDSSRRGGRASGPSRRPWPGDLTAACEPSVPGGTRGQLPQPAPPPSMTGPITWEGLASPSLGTVAPMPTGDAGFSPDSLRRLLP